jgi:hypothetical protein
MNSCEYLTTFIDAVASNDEILQKASFNQYSKLKMRQILGNEKSINEEYENTVSK